MADWEKLNKEFDEFMNNLSDEEFEAWLKKSHVNRIYKKAKVIFESDSCLFDKYNLLFSNEICGQVGDLFDWVDNIDTTYEEDVKSFMKSFQEYVKQSNEK